MKSTVPVGVGVAAEVTVADILTLAPTTEGEEGKPIVVVVVFWISSEKAAVPASKFASPE